MVPCGVVREDVRDENLMYSEANNIWIRADLAASVGNRPSAMLPCFVLLLLLPCLLLPYYSHC
jgi:hypothetical protein